MKLLLTISLVVMAVAVWFVVLEGDTHHYTLQSAKQVSTVADNLCDRDPGDLVGVTQRTIEEFRGKGNTLSVQETSEGKLAQVEYCNGTLQIVFESKFTDSGRWSDYRAVVSTFFPNK